MGNTCGGAPEEEKKHMHVIVALQETGLRFHDTEFPAGPESLLGCWEDEDFNPKELGQQWAKIQWERIVDNRMIKKKRGEHKLFEASEAVSATDIEHGALNDYYFLSTLAVLTEWPGLIQKLFAVDTVNQEGVFSTYLHQDGERVEIVVDNYIPCLDGIPMFSHSKTHQLWVMVLEKTWAKLLGSYEAILTGWVHETLRDLLGAPSYEYIIADQGQESILEILKTAYKKKYILSAGVNADDAEESKKIETLGLNSNYSLAILGVFEV